MIFAGVEFFKPAMPIRLAAMLYLVAGLATETNRRRKSGWGHLPILDLGFWIAKLKEMVTLWFEFWIAEFGF